MPAVQETVDQVRRIDVDQYKYGFETLIESEKAPKGLSEDTVRFISAKKNEPEWMLAWRLDAYQALAHHARAEMGQGRIRPDRLSEHLLLLRAEAEGRAEVARRDRPGNSAHLREARHSVARAEMLLGMQKPAGEDGEEGDEGGSGYGRVAVDAVFDSVSVATTFKAELAKAGVLFMPISEALQEHPELVKKYLGTVVPISDNFFATLNSAVFSDGSFVYVPPGVRCPMELSTYFRINERNTGQFERTLIIADKGSYVSYLEGCTAPMRDENQLHAAVVELSRSTTPRSSIRPSRTGIRATPPAAAASTISSPSAAIAAARTRRFPGPSSRPARPSPGNIRAASCAATIRAANSTRSPSPTATSRSIPAPRCCISARTRRAASSPRASPPGNSNNTYRGLVTAHRRATGARNFTNCDSLLIGDQCGAHTVPYIEAKNSSTVFEHEATTSKISEEMLFYCRQRGLSAEEAVALVVNGFVKDVLQQLPMEFAVEAQKLISISLEGSVG